jgi:hypothetical protein
LKQAQDSGDQQSVKAAKDALALAKQIYDIKTAQYAAESKQQATQAKPSTSGTASNNNSFTQPGSTTPTRAPTSNPAQQTVRVELAMPSGRAYPAQMAPTDASAFLADIERNRSTSL